MEMVFKPEIFFYSLISLLLGVVGYFLKQLHSDFKKVEKDVAEVRTTTALMKAEIKSIQDLLNQKIGFLENQVNHLKTVFFNKQEHGKESNGLG